MAFSEVDLPVSRYKFFTFYADSTSSMNETFDPGFAFDLTGVRVHLSTGHASVEDFNVQARVAQTTALGSTNVFNAILFSYAINGSTDYVWHPSRTMIFNYGDVLSLSMYMSAANHFGLTIQGWAITS